MAKKKPAKKPVAKKKVPPKKPTPKKPAPRKKAAPKKLPAPVTSVVEPDNLEQVVVLVDKRVHHEPVTHGNARIVTHSGKAYEYTGTDKAGRRMYRQQ